MRGGVTRSEAFMMSPGEREDAIDYINRKLELEEKMRQANHFGAMMR